jgi:hypothetical protein
MDAVNKLIELERTDGVEFTPAMQASSKRLRELIAKNAELVSPGSTEPDEPTQRN